MKEMYISIIIITKSTILITKFSPEKHLNNEGKQIKN